MKLFLLPGMGADASVFRAVENELPSLTVLEWLPPLDNETLPDYARRLAAALPTERPLWIGGMSFGGMVVRAAVFAGRVLPPAALVLRQRLGRTVARMAGRFISPENSILLDQFTSADAGFLR